MEFLLGILVGGVITFFYWQAVVTRAIAEGFYKVTAAAESAIKNLTVTVEQEGDQFLLYQTDTNRFLMQGTSMADFRKRLPALNVDALTIENSSSTAAQALLEASLIDKESNENSNNK